MALDESDAPAKRVYSNQATKQLQAVRWILEGREKGIFRSQMKAAEKFGIRQSVVSLGMKKYVASGSIPDGRRREYKKMEGASPKRGGIKWTKEMFKNP